MSDTLRLCGCGGKAVVEKNETGILAVPSYRLKCDRCGLVVELAGETKFGELANPYDVYDRMMQALKDEWNRKQE